MTLLGCYYKMNDATGFNSQHLGKASINPNGCVKTKQRISPDKKKKIVGKIVYGLGTR